MKFKICLTMFQSPRSGKFVSDHIMGLLKTAFEKLCFNPLDRGNLYQISQITARSVCRASWFQSPRSGKFVSDIFIFLKEKT